MRRQLALLLMAALAGCGLLGPNLTGQWETEATPKRTLDLRTDGTYTQRFSGKTLSIVSDLVGPEAGTWRIDGDTLVLTQKDKGGGESITRLPIHESSGDALVLGDDRWRRKTGASTPNTTATPKDDDEE